MIGSPGGAWINTVDFHSLVVGGDHAASAALITLFAVGYAAWSRAWTPLVVAGSALLIAVTGAALHLYPLGGSRHVAWLLVFVVPTAARGVAVMFTSGRKMLVLSLVLFTASFSVGNVSGVCSAQTRLRKESVSAPSKWGTSPRWRRLWTLWPSRISVFMSEETYNMLSPLFTLERQTARKSRDGSLTHLVWGSRNVFVLPDWDFASRPDQIGLPNHLYTASQRAAGEFLNSPRRRESRSCSCQEVGVSRVCPT